MDFSHIFKRMERIQQLAKIVKKEKCYSQNQTIVKIIIYEALFAEYNASIFNISIVEDSDSFRIYAEVTGEQGKFAIKGVRFAVYVLNVNEPFINNYPIKPDTFLGFEVVECYCPNNLSQVIGIKIAPEFVSIMTNTLSFPHTS